MKNLFLTVLLLTLAGSTQSWAAKASLQQNIDSLGDDQAIVQRAKALDPNNEVNVVQKRAVDRHSRLELGMDYGIVGGGDSFLNSQAFGGNLDFHITPYWSVGVRYMSYINNLTAEGKAFYDAINRNLTTSQAYLGGGAQPPAVDSPSDTELFIVNWYPIYGKMNIGNWIPHFDIYLLGGYGKTNTDHTSMADTFTAGGGMGLWLSNNIALRLEARYQTYNDKPYWLYTGRADEQRRLDQLVGQASLGILL